MDDGAVMMAVVVEVIVFESALVNDVAMRKHNERKEISMVGIVGNVKD